MRTNHADGSRQAQTAINRRPRLRKARILALVLAPFLASSASAGSDKDSLSLSPLAVPSLTKPVSTKTSPANKQSLHELGEASYPRTHYQKALYLRQKGDLDAALIEFLKATQVNPHLVRAFYEQALIFRERHYLKLAESALEQALAVKPDYQPARILLATVRLEQGNLTGAVSELSRSLGLAPTKTNPSSVSQWQPEVRPQDRPNYVPLPGEPLPGARAPSLMQTPHTLLPEPPAPVPVSPAPPSFDPAPAQVKEVPGETSSTHTDPERQTGFAPEPFQLEGSPSGPPVRPTRSIAQNDPESTSGTKTASTPSAQTPGFWLRALPGSSNRSHGTPPPASRLPFTGNWPGLDFKLPNPFGFLKKNFFQDAKPQQHPPAVPPPQSNVADLSPQAAPAVQKAPPTPSTLPVQPPLAPQILQSIQPALKLQQPKPMPQSALLKPSPVKPDAKKSSAGWLDKVIASVRELSAATLAGPRESSAKIEKTVDGGQPSQAEQNVESIPMVVFAGKPNPRQTRAPAESYEPLAMVIRQPPPALFERQADAASSLSQPAADSPPQPVPVAMMRWRPPLPSPRDPAEAGLRQTLPAQAPIAAQSSPRPALEPVALPDRPLVAALPPPLPNLAPVARQPAEPAAPALPAARSRSAQLPAQPAALSPNPGVPPPLPRAPAHTGMLKGLLPSWIFPAPLSLASGDSAPTPRPVGREPPRQPMVEPNRIEQRRAPLIPVRAVGRPPDANPLAFLFGSGPGPKPTPPPPVDSQQAPRPSAATPSAQILAPPLTYSRAEVEPAPAPAQPGESPKLVQHPVQPLAILQRAAVQAPLPPATQPVIQQQVQPSSISRLSTAGPQPPRTPLRSGIQPPVPQTMTVPTALAFAGDQTAPSPRQLQQLQQGSDQSIKPSRIDEPRNTLVQISAVGRAPAPAALMSTPVKTEAPLPLPTAQTALAPPAVQGSEPAAQQVHAQNPPAPSGTPIASTLAYSNLPGSQSRLLAMAGARLPAAYLTPRAQTRSAAASPPPPPRVEQLDPVAKRMKYLAEHGTASLKAGEAFMFSEETGEAILFQSNGETLRRKIAEPQDGQQVVRNRRPDLAFPQELKYNLSLLAKLLPHQEEPKPQTPPPAQPSATFTLNELIAKPDGMFGWLRQLFRL